MPNVPIYSTPTVAPGELPGIRQQTPYRMMQAAEIGPNQVAKLGNALTSAGVQTLDLMTHEQILTNEIKGKNFATSQVTGNDAITHGSDDGKIPGYLSLKGEDAMKAYDETVAKLKQIPIDLAKDLDNPAQQQLVDNVSKMQLEAALNQVKAHRDQQIQVADKTAAQTRVAVNASSATKGYNPVTDTPLANFDHDNPANNSAYQQSLLTVETETRSLWAGNKPDVIQAKVDEMLGNVYAQTLGYILGGKHGGGDVASVAVAQKYFESVKDQLTPAQIEAADGALKTRATLVNAQTAADDVYSRFGAAKDEKSALEAVYKITDPEVRQKTLAMVKERFNSDQMISERGMRDADNKGLLALTNGGTLQSLMNSDTWGGMSAHAQHTAQEWVRSNQLHNAQLSQIDKMADMAGYQQILQLRQDNPAAFAGLDIVKTAKELGIKSPATVGQIINMQASYNKGDAAEAAFNTAFKNARVLYGPLLVNAGLTPLPGMDPNKKAAADTGKAAFEAQVQGDIQDWMKANGNKIPDGKALDTIIKQNLTPMFIRDTGSWFGLGSDQTKLLGTMKADERAKAYTISASDLQKQNPAQYRQLSDSLKTKFGRVPTPVEIENQYTAMMLMMKGK